jgi:hypothetical protein
MMVWRWTTHGLILALVLAFCWADSSTLALWGYALGLMAGNIERAEAVSRALDKASHDR